MERAQTTTETKERTPATANAAANTGKKIAAKLKAEEENAEVAMDRLKEVGRNLGDQIETQLRERPSVVIGVATGLGFVAGRLMGSRLGQIAVALAGGYLVRNVITHGGVGNVVRDGIERLTDERAVD